jgi:Brp/Blh family beta-carotene 15,15'-monooxygenase
LKLAPPTAAALERSLERLEPAAEAGRFPLCAGPRAIPWCALGAAAALAWIAPEATASTASWPFVIALFAFGMPHGAADWTVAARLAGRSTLASRLAGFTGYLLMMAACTAFMAWQPGVAALLFLLLTVFHFGMADATSVHADRDGAMARWGLVLGRGLLLLSTAFASHPQAAWAPFAEIGDAFCRSPAWTPDLDSLQAMARLGVGSGVAFALCSALARTRAGHPREAGRDLAEHALVTALAAWADPLFAVGVFFLGVHAFRHARRLACTRAVLEPPPAERALAARLVRVHLLSLPLMWPTALCLAPLCWLLGGFGMHELAVASIAFYMITTLPHHLLGLELPQPDLAPARDGSADARGPAAVHA